MGLLKCALCAALDDLYDQHIQPGDQSGTSAPGHEYKTVKGRNVG